jgi:hypothetical protein
MPFSLTTLNAFEMTCRTAACEIPAKHPGHRAFVGIYPPTKGISNWRIKRFETPADLVTQDPLMAICSTWSFIRVSTLQEDGLRSWGITPSLFDAPWKCDWPF